MTIPTVTPYTGGIPDGQDPATFDDYANAFVNWQTQDLVPDLNASINALNAGLNGSQSFLDALENMQGEFDALGEASGYNVSDHANFEVATGQLVTRAAIALFVADQIDAQKPDIIIWDHGLSGDLTSLNWQNLSKYSRVRLDFINLDLSSDNVVRKFQLSNASGSYLTSGYVVSTYDDASGQQKTDGIRIHDQTDAITHIGYIEFMNTNNPNVQTTFEGIIHKAKIVGFHNSKQIHSGLRLTLGGATVKGGSVIMTGWP